MRVYIHDGELYDTAKDFCLDSGELPEDTLVLDSSLSVDKIYSRLMAYGCPELMSKVIELMT